MRKNHVRIFANVAGNPAPPSRPVDRHQAPLPAARPGARGHSRRCALLRDAGKLRAFLPLTAARVAELERQAPEHLRHNLFGPQQPPKLRVVGK